MENNFTLTKMNSQELNELHNAFAVKEVSEDNAELRFTTNTNDTLLFNALRGKSEPVSDYIGETVEVTDIVVSAADMLIDRNDESKGKENHPIIHFFTADGKHLSTASNGIRRNVVALFEVGKIPSAENPIKIEFDEVETKKGTAQTFNLV